MKKITGILILLLYIHNVGRAQSQVSQNEVVSAAVCKMKQLYAQSTPIAQEIDTILSSTGEVLMYEVQMSDGYRVLMSSRKSYIPVLAVYKRLWDGSSTWERGEPETIRMIRESYKRGLETIFTRNIVHDFSAQWDSLINETSQSSQTRAMPPLLTSHWREQFSNDWVDATAYNCYCPEINGCKTLAGSAAVAMGQLMYYWQYPFFSTNGAVWFDWCNMGDELRVGDQNYETKKHSIGTLLRECGLATNTNYGCNLSSAKPIDVITALKNVFLFSTEDGFEFPLSIILPDLTPDMEGDYVNMMSKIKKDINRNRPVLCCLEESNDNMKYGICDGYTNNVCEVHINWGDIEGYFSFYNNIYYGFLYNTCPKINMVGGEIFLSDFYETYWNHDLNIPPHHFAPLTALNMVSAERNSSPSWRTIPTGETAVYQAQDEIVLQDGFEAERGCEFTAQIVPCGRYSRGVSDEFRENSDDTAAEYRYASVAPDAQLPQAELYPNPTDGPLFMPTDGMATAVLVYDLMGRPVGGWHLSALTETGVDLDVSALRPGAYLLAVQTEAGTKTARFVRK